MNEQMINVENVAKTTRITICNYDDYQGLRNDDETMEKRSRNDDETIADPNKNDKKNKKDKKNTSSVAKAPVKLHTICKNYFHEKFRQLFSDEYYWEAKDAANLNAILKKIKYNRESKNMPIDDENVSKAFSVFLDSIKDKWILENYSISNINSKFNEIISQAKNGRAKQQGIRPTSSELQAAVEIGIGLAEAYKG
jgi:hypothetical protein